ncbi:hypothetical protein TYRP_021167 [Tyrophagus putrescentiae]|nr:hypothetical protein TYRP_021167 [Tyrophagus putrescentiae]
MPRPKKSGLSVDSSPVDHSKRRVCRFLHHNRREFSAKADSEPPKIHTILIAKYPTLMISIQKEACYSFTSFLNSSQTERQPAVCFGMPPL